MILLGMKLYMLVLSLLLSLQPLSAIHKVVEKVKPSIVYIITEENSFDTSYPDPWFFQESLRSFYEWMWPAQHYQGSGFIISSDGYIVTNEHVVEGATDLLVVMQTGNKRIRKAKVIGKDPRSDIAVLKLYNHQKESFPFLTFGDSRKAKVGDPVFPAGNPIDAFLETTVTSGIISAVNRSGGGVHEIEGYIQTDAPINGGNSGGPLLNKEGEVIGVAAWIYDHFWGHEGIGFAIPSHVAEGISNQIIKTGQVTEGYFGALMDFSVDCAFNNFYIIPRDGAYISQVQYYSPAGKAGLKAGDKILSINGIPIDSAYTFDNEIQCCPARSKIDLTVDRNGEILKIPVTLGADVLH